jgi:hypothetical protein
MAGANALESAILLDHADWDDDAELEDLVHVLSLYRPWEGLPYSGVDDLRAAIVAALGDHEAGGCVTPGDEGRDDWRRLLRVSATTWLGRVEGDDGTLWTADDGGARRRQVDLGNPMDCLPLLERPYGDVTDDLARATRVGPAATRDATSRLIPGGVVEAALHIGTDHWLRGACAWLAALTPSEQAAAWAFRIENAPGAGQSTRHAARRVRRSWPPGQRWRPV